MRCLIVLIPVALVLGAELADAEPVRNTHTEADVDWISAGISGVGGGSGQIQLTGVSGQVRRAFLYWHGVDLTGNGGDGAYDNETVSVNGNSVTGQSLGDATTNCWGNGSSRAFRADVTQHVTGNGTYTITGLSAKTGHSANGASLVVVFDDGNPANDRDLVFFEGNDVNIPEGFPGEDAGWNATLSGINYGGGMVNVQMHVADGQDFGDGTIVFAGAANVTINDSASLWDGTSVPSAGTSRAPNGQLWDIHGFDVTAAFGAPGPQALNLSGQVGTNDCLSLVLLLMDLEGGSAPPTSTPTVTPTATVGQEGCTEYFAEDLPKAIPDSGSVSSSLGVPTGGSITDVNVIALIGDHTYVGDLTFRLFGPYGSNVVVIDRVCGSADDFDLDLDDSAPSAIPCPPTDAAPHVPSNPLAAFNGQDAAGTWTLQITDSSSSDDGTLFNWGLRICVGAARPTATPSPTPRGADCCSEHPQPGCEVPACQNCVCDVVPGCCSIEWDEFCREVANNECALACACGVTATPTSTRTRTPTFTPTPTLGSISGRIRYYSADRSVPDATVTLYDPAKRNVLTASDGAYVFPSVSPVNCEIVAQKNGEVGSAISALDASWILQTVVEKRTFDAYQNLACDVTGNGTVGALDASRILQFVVGKISRFSVADSCGSDWAFVPVPAPAANQTMVWPGASGGSCTTGKISFSPLEAAAADQNFYGVVFGDCTGNWQPLAGAGAVHGVRDTSGVRLGRLRRTRGGTLRVPVIFRAGPPRHSVQIELGYDPSKLRVEKVVGTARIGEAIMESNVERPGIISIAAASGKEIPSGRLFLIEMKPPTRAAAVDAPVIVSVQFGE